MGKTALLVVDVQNSLVGAHPYRERAFLSELQRLLEAAREGGTEVIFVRHGDGPGSELEAGTDGWQIAAAVAPLPGEQIFEKAFNSAFRSTGLREYLDARGVRRIVLCGMQTEYCIDATCKAAFEYGFSTVVPSGATTTFSNAYLSGEKLTEYYEKAIWAGRFAAVVPPEEAVALLRTGKK